MKEYRKEIVVFLLVVFVLMQFIRPERNISDVVLATDFFAMTNPPQEIQPILTTSCYDCHSNNTKYPWYSKIAPVSYWLSDHIKNGKKHLNFSEWERYSSKQKIRILNKIEEEVKEKQKMPLYSYLQMHPEAKLSEDQIETLINWTDDLKFIYQLGVK